MGLKDFFRKAAPTAQPENSQPESAVADALRAQFVSNSAVWNPTDPQTLVAHAYERNPYVHTAINLVAEGVAELPFTLFEVKGKKAKAVKQVRKQLFSDLSPTAYYAAKASGDLSEAPENSPAAMVLGKPNPEQDFSALVQDILTWWLISGDAFLEKARSTRGTIGALYVHRPERVKYVPGVPPQWEFRIGADVRRFPAADIAHWRRFSGSHDIYGCSPLKAASRSVDLINAAQAWQVSTLQNGARPSGILEIQPPPAATTGDGTLTKWVRRVQGLLGPKNAGKPFVLETPHGSMTKWTQTAYAPADLDWLGGVRLSAAQVAMVYRVPPIMLGDTESSTYSNMQEARKGLYQDAIFPTSLRFCKWFTAHVLSEFAPNLVLLPDFDNVQAAQEDKAKQAEWTVKVFTSGLIRRNEGRSVLGWAADPVLGELYADQIKGLNQQQAKHLDLYQAPACCEGHHDPKS